MARSIFILKGLNEPVFLKIQRAEVPPPGHGIHPGNLVLGLRAPLFGSGRWRYGQNIQ